MANERSKPAVPQDLIEQSILLVRGHKVLLDEMLADLYGVKVKVLNQAVKRNIERFPDDFMFQLTDDEAASLRSQSVTLKTGRGKHRKYTPYAFTEQGVAMLSSVLRSPQAVAVNIEIMRAFVRLRQILAVNTELARRLEEIERRVGEHDEQFVTVIRAIRQLMEPAAPPPRRRIGFHAGDGESVTSAAGRKPRNASRLDRKSKANRAYRTNNE